MEEIIKTFLEPGSGSSSGDGYGYGYGSGDGSGSGSGYGYGYGFGSSSGDGYGYGYGSGYGFGSSSGDGSGYGYGSGDGSGSGSGDGSGSGVKAFKGKIVYQVDGIQTLIDHVHGNIARGRILQKDLQLIPCYIAKGGGHFAHGETIREAQKALEEKIMDDLPVEEKIAEFKKKFKPGGSYPARDFYDWHHFLTGSCEMGRRQFAKEHGIDIEKDAMTPEAFMELTKDKYGGSVIRKLMEEWKQ